MKQDFVTIILILAIIVLVVFIVKKDNNNSDAETAKCIALKSKLYVSTGCSACAAQESLFGENFKYLNVIDCAVTPEECKDITRVPTWIINNKKEEGLKTIENLKNLTGC